jgi:hypothetical protein
MFWFLGIQLVAATMTLFGKVQPDFQMLHGLHVFFNTFGLDIVYMLAFAAEIDAWRAFKVCLGGGDSFDEINSHIQNMYAMINIMGVDLTEDAIEVCFLVLLAMCCGC